MKLQPLADRIVAKSIEEENKNPSGIILPDSAKEKPQLGEVIAIGKEVKEIKVGDRILYTKYGPTETKINNEDLLLLKEEDVLAVVKT